MSSLAVAAVFAVPSLAAAGTASWPTWGDSNARTGDASGSLLRASNLHSLEHVWTTPLGGYVDSQPLFLSGVLAHGARHDLYITATESGVVSALDARKGALVWRAQLPVTHTTCAQIPGGTFGVTGTPTYDATRHSLYVSTQNLVFALDIATGRVRTGWPVTLGYDPAQEHVWGALAQNGRYVYLATASFCDDQPYKGRVFRVDVRNRQVLEWDAVPTPGDNGGGGIWGWGGLSIDPSGNVWAATGNSIGPDVNGDGDFDGESVVELSSSLQRLRGSKPPGVPRHGDYDFGSTPLLFTPKGCPPLTVALNKNGSLYLWKRNQLAAGPTQRIQLAFPATLIGLPAWDPRTRMLYLTTTLGYRGVDSGLHGLTVTPGCKLALKWTQPLGSLLDSVPVVVNDTVLVATGTGKLDVFAPASGTPLASYRLGSHPAFISPIAVGRDVAVTSWNKQIDVFRLPARTRRHH